MLTGSEALRANFCIFVSEWVVGGLAKSFATPII